MSIAITVRRAVAADRAMLARLLTLEGERLPFALLADRGGETLDEVGAATNLTRERIRQLEAVALRALRVLPLTCELADVEHTDSRGEVADADDGSGARTTSDAVSGLSDFCSGGGGAAWSWGQ